MTVKINKMTTLAGARRPTNLAFPMPCWKLPQLAGKSAGYTEKYW
jgi:hypothetical protein